MDRAQLQELAEQEAAKAGPLTPEARQLLPSVFGPHLQATTQPTAKRARKRAEAA